MKSIITILFLTLSITGFAQNTESAPISVELQKEKLIVLNSVTDNMSFARKERYLDSLQSAGIIIRKNTSKNSKGCTLEDREQMFGKPTEEVLIFLK